MARLLTPGEVKKQFGYSPKQMRDYEGQGLIDPYKTPGGHRRYDPAAVETMFEKANQPIQELTRQNRYTEWGTSGLRQWGGSIYEERLRALQGREGRIEFREMRRNDPVIAAIFFAILNALRQTSPRIAPASEKSVDVEVAEYTESCLFDMSFSWEDTFTFVTEPQLEQGFSLLEVTYKKRLGSNPPKYIENPATSLYDDGRISWRKMAPRPAETLAQGSEWVFDDNGGLQGIIQQPETTFGGRNNTIYIPIQKLLHFRTTVHPANNPEGVPIHRAMYLPYYYSRHIAELEAIGIERNLNGIPVAYMGDDTTRSGDNSDFSKLQDLVTNIRIDEQAGIVIPYAKMGEGAREGNGVLLELLSPRNSTGGSQFDLTKTLDRLDKLKAVAVLAQFIMLGMNNVGSYALSRHHGDIFILAVSAFLQSIAGVFNRHAIPKLIGMNSFPGMTGFPELKFSTVGVPDLETLATYVNKLVDKAVITPDPELERHLRQAAELPDLPEDQPAGVKPVPTGDDDTEKGLKKKWVHLLKQDPPTGLSENGRKAYGVTDDLGEEIGAAWDEFRQDVLKGVAIAAAIASFRKKMSDLFADSYLVLWSIARGDEANLKVERPQIDKGIDEALGYLDNFMDEFKGELQKAPGNEERGSLFGRRLHRILSYTGGAWGFYNLGKIFGKPKDELWVWDGPPVDSGTCPTCTAERPKPPRPLSQMLLPVVDTICKAGCRHEVRRARASDFE